MDRKQRGRLAAEQRRPLSVRRFRPELQLLEDRLTPATLEVPLDPLFDAFGNQFEVVQIYRNDDDFGDRVTFGIFDTGASPVTFGWTDQFFFELIGQPIPLLPDPLDPNSNVEVTAEGIGGTLTGFVTEPGTILADGLHAVNLDAFISGFDAIDMTGAAAVANVQAMMGTESGSPNLPSIVGTPIMNGRLPGATEDGVAVLIDQQGYFIDFGALFPEFPEFEDLILPMPDLAFVAPGTRLTTEADTTAPVRVPLDFIGIDNHLDPGNTLTESYNPVVSVDLTNTVDGATLAVNDQVFLFDTGAQLSIISTAIAEALGLDLANPEFTIDVGGAGGTVSVGGFTISELTLPLDDDNDGVVEGSLVFTQAPVFVLDLGDLDGILGMNLFNTAAKMLYDPHDPDGGGPAEASLRLTFSTLPRDEYEPEGEAVDALNSMALFAPLAASLRGNALPSFNLNVPPTITANQTVVTVAEGQTASNTGTFADINDNTIQLSASLGTVTKSGDSSGAWNWSLATTDGPAGPTTVNITATDGQDLQAVTFTVTVDNVKPTIALAGASEVNKLERYTLQLGPVVDPGSDTVTGYRVNWGDGTTTGQISGTPNGNTAQHQYVAAGSHTITVDLYDEDGAPHAAAGSKSILVRDVAPNLIVIQKGKPARVARGGIATLTLTIFNFGNTIAGGAFITQQLPTRMSLVRAGSTPGWHLVGPRTYRLLVGSLQPGQSIRVTFKARIAAAAPRGIKLNIVALVADDGAHGPDANLADNQFKLGTIVG